MIDEAMGDVRMDNGVPRVEFERVLEAAIDVVWAMLASDEGLERWLAPARVDLRVGGAMGIDFGEDGIVGGEIIELIPGAVLEYHWRFTGEPDSIVRFELEVIDPDTTKLRLDHRLLPGDHAADYGAGWHTHLDQLAQVVVGREPMSWDERFHDLLPRYESLVSTV